MQSLPYELLQQISSCLLPRYQCRLALASRHCYLYLYTDLLRWHAKRALIPAPKYTIYYNHEVDKKISIMVIPSYNPRVILIKYRDEILEIKDLTNMNVTMCMEIGVDNYVCYCDKDEGVYVVYNDFRAFREFNILRGHHRHINIDALILYINMRQPIHSVDWPIMKKIYGYLEREDSGNLLGSNIWLF